jgi:hypothetical protein
MRTTKMIADDEAPALRIDSRFTIGADGGSAPVQYMTTGEILDEVPLAAESDPVRRHA